MPLLPGIERASHDTEVGQAAGIEPQACRRAVDEEVVVLAEPQRKVLHSVAHHGGDSRDVRVFAILGCEARFAPTHREGGECEGRYAHREGVYGSFGLRTP